MRRLMLFIAPFAITSCNQPQPTPVQPPAPAQTAAASEVGRFVIVHSPQVERDTVLLDTVTGQTWSEFEATNLKDHPTLWKPLAREDNDAEVAAVLKEHPVLEQAHTK